MKYAFIVIAFLSVACSKLTDEHHFYIEPRLKYFVDKFYVEAAKRNVPLQKDNLILISGNLKQAPNGDNTDGRTFFELNEVVINKNIIDYSIDQPYSSKEDSLHVEYVVFHELGHYLLNRGHIDFDKAFTIMTPDSFYLGDYESSTESRKKLIDELFSK